MVADVLLFEIPPGMRSGLGVAERRSSKVGGVGTSRDVSAATKGGVSMPAPPAGVADPSKGVTSRPWDCPSSPVCGAASPEQCSGAGQGVGLTLPRSRGPGEGVGLAGGRGAGDGVSAGCTSCCRGGEPRGSLSWMSTLPPSLRVCSAARPEVVAGSICSCRTALGLAAVMASAGAGDQCIRGDGMSAVGVPHCSGDAGGVARPPVAMGIAFECVEPEASE